LVARSVTVYPFRFAAMSDLADEVSDSLPSKKKKTNSHLSFEFEPVKTLFISVFMPVKS